MPNTYLFFITLLLLIGCNQFEVKVNLPLKPGQGLPLPDSQPESQFLIHETVSSLAVVYGGSVQLKDGRILQLGSTSPALGQLNVRIYNPLTALFISGPIGPMLTVMPMMSVLSNGKVLVAGGQNITNYSIASDSALFDPTTLQWETTGNLNDPRAIGKMAALEDGRAVIVGGTSNNSTYTLKAEIFDPITKQWSYIQDPPFTGNVPILKLISGTNTLLYAGTHGTESYIYDPVANDWILPAPTTKALQRATSVSLSTGEIIVVGGIDLYGNTLSEVNIYNPSDNSWRAVGALNIARAAGAITLTSSGKVFVCGGLASSSSLTDTCELFDPSTETWNQTINLPEPQYFGALHLLPNNHLFYSSGSGLSTIQTNHYFIGANGDTFSSQFNLERSEPLTIPIGNNILIAGGGSVSSGIYNSQTKTWEKVGDTSSLRHDGHIFKLPNGKILITGGSSKPPLTNITPLYTTEIYDPGTKTWTLGESLNTHRIFSAAAQLSNGKILIAGGESSETSAEIYDPTTGTWNYTANPKVATMFSRAVSLPSDKILVIGGYSNDIQEYDASTDEWEIVAQLQKPHLLHQSILLDDGNVLTIGGFDLNNSVVVADTELYDPVTKTSTEVAPLTVERMFFTASKLSDGKIMVTGGSKTLQGAGENSIEVYDPATKTWSGYSIDLTTGRTGHSATLLNNNLYIF